MKLQPENGSESDAEEIDSLCSEERFTPAQKI